MTNPEFKSTVNYYNEYAEEFIENTFSAKISDSLDNFSQLLSSNSHILDVGCGSGRDTLSFLEKGFNVTAFDASPELASLASKKINHPVLVKNIEDMDWINYFDAVWAMASLLHLKKEMLPLAIKNCVQSLKEEGNGLFFASFKMGQGDGYDEKGRFFSYYSQEELKSILEETGYFESIKFDINKDKLGRAGLSWISFIAVKKPNLILNPIKNNKFKI